MKLSQIQKQLRNDKITYLLLTSTDPNFTYFTQLKNLFFALLFIPQKGKPFFFHTSLDQEKTPKTTKNILIKKSSTTQPLQKTLRKYLKPKILAYNSQNLTLYSYKKFKKIFLKTRFKDFSKSLQQLRTEKTEKEIYYLKKAAQLTTSAFQQIIKRLKQNKLKTENNIKFFLQKFALDHNTELSFPPIVASGTNIKNPHHQTSNKKLTKGFLLIDFGISYKNYCSDMTRMLYLGKPSQKELETYNFLLDIQKQTIKNLKPNQKTKEIDQQVRKQLKNYSSYFTHSLGHGLGIEIHECPSFKPESKDIIKPDQIFTIEPGLYFKNFGLRIEDTILLKDKPIILTKTKKELVVIKQ